VGWNLIRLKGVSPVSMSARTTWLYKGQVMSVNAQLKTAEENCCALYQVVVKGRRNAKDDQPAVLCAARNLTPGTLRDVSGRNVKVGQTIAMSFPQQPRSGTSVDNADTALEKKKHASQMTVETPKARIAWHHVLWTSST
jgi:hypothetical protein